MKEDTLTLLNPLVPPQSPGLWPPGPLTWLVIASLLLAFIAMLCWRHYNATRLRRYAYQELDSIRERHAAHLNNARYLYELNLLLRRLAVRNFRREHVAALTGSDWLTFLDNSLNTHEFSQGCGHVLAHGAYKAEPGQLDTAALHQLVRSWIKHQT
ncbi:hypothetical protein BFW38_10630 [Terasakiispira papahanaumokuakeensis]|uniref:DUF4381 domain-containing protein n=1 Tax=Terasakiispira papahanaumokuakeensis TaxID=197479 RepID=A0A1E2VB96_9GAMM|nr:DUF4381 domain-containing protein [Terasakiispira papahanaumokuakeensis]ODC03925.1 hypothetical protein BFW38_10630 [Terasakiispira papahanaumokuakeensis]